MTRESLPVNAEQPGETGEAPPIANRDTKSGEALGRQIYLARKGIKKKSDYQLDSVFASLMEDREDKRHLPNDLGRSSLFTTRSRKIKRQSMTREKLFHYNEEISIYFSGVELRAEDDELIWLQILNYGKSVPLGEPF